MVQASPKAMVVRLAVLTALSWGVHADWIAGYSQRLQSHQEAHERRVKRQSLAPSIDVERFHVETKIAVRFASTTISSTIYNSDFSIFEPLDFVMQLPSNAYIASFSLEVDGVTYHGRVRDKCDGEDENTFDASGSLSSGRISALEPNKNTFMVSVNVAPRETVRVMINYQELLERIQGWYTQRISVNPRQAVGDFRLSAYITEPQRISKIEVGLVHYNRRGATSGGYRSTGSSGGMYGGTGSSYTSLDDAIQRIGRTRVNVNYAPVIHEQETIGDGASGIDGDWIIRYDTQHQFGVGHVHRLDDIFVHHFSPSGLNPIRKTVAFVIDVSASMYGRKLNQTKEALSTIMSQMRPADRFNIITFSNEVYYWREDEMVQASSWNVERAKQHISSLAALAGTNLNAAMIEGLEQLRLVGAMEPISASNPGICILFVLTDGAPSKGVTDPRTIERNVEESNRGRCSVVTLGFGAEDVDFNFLARLAIGNNGVARKIYDNSAVSEQLIGVYDEVATPLLVNVAIEYLDNVVDEDSLTKTFFQNYFEGSEFAISGQLANLLAADLPIRITAISASGEITIEEDVPITDSDVLSSAQYVPADFAHRTAAFITLAQLFNQYTVSDDDSERRMIVEQAVELSQRFNLLTPLMSLKFVDSDPTTSGRGRAVDLPASLQWGIRGSGYEQRSTGHSRTYGIGGRICTYEPENVIDLYRLYIESLITDRYARTTFSGKIANRATDRQDVPFTLHIPPGAFISEFTVEVDGRTYTGQVGDIRDPNWQEIFPSSGRNIALITRRDPTKDTFNMRVLGVAPLSTVTFDLTYDELLERRLGVYENRINLWLGQEIDDFQLNVYVTEPQGIGDIELWYHPREEARQDLRVRRTSDYTAHMRYAPTADEQLVYSSNGMVGDIVLQYDVLHTTDGSYMEVQDGYFVQFFSPISFQQAAKFVVFVIDISSSMVGTKLRQVKEALKLILDDLDPRDRFNILVFSDNVQHWRRNSLVQVTRRDIDAAKRFVDGLVVQGETNLCEAIIQADALLDLQSGLQDDDENILSMMYVLSDGQPTIGVKDPDELVRTVNAAIDGEHALFCLGFGRNVSFDLLIQLGLRNRGYARKIHETSRASDQLLRSYFEVSRPVIFDVEVKYQPGVPNPDDLTVQTFPYYFEGSELAVAGTLLDAPTSTTLESSVVGETAMGQQYLEDTRRDIRFSRSHLSSDHAVTDVVQRIWATKTIQDLVNQYAINEDPSSRQILGDRIAYLAIRNNFVTPLTPMAMSTQGQPAGTLQPPTVLHTGTNMDILSLLEDLPVPVQPLIPGDSLNVATKSSDGIKIRSLTIDSTIVLRFAMTSISSTMINTNNKAGWAVFTQKIPLQAFVTGFTLNLNGKTYQGGIDEKNNNVVLQGNLEVSLGGAFITELDPESKVFLVSVKLEPQNYAEFMLSYEMLLPRRRGIYQYRLGIYPGQVVDTLQVDVSITEPQGVRMTNAYLMDRSYGDALANLPQPTTRLSANKRRVRYHPTRQEQRELSSDGVMGDFIVEYDVYHANDAGDIQVLNNHFVQFFSPSGLSVLRKHVTFIIDTSSSMEGTKLSQVKAALNTILEDISPGDKFNILPFSNKVQYLDRYRMVDALPDNIRYAKTYVDKLVEIDATNLNDAILKGVNMLRREEEKLRGDKVVSMLVVLTDGEPTYGEIDKREIERNVQDAINGDYSLFCLAFGEDADFGFLNRLALNNHGTARRIPERADTSVLLKGFYDEVATPLLYDVQFYYSDGVVPNTLSERFFSNYFNGTEIVVVGKLNENRLSDHVLRSFIYGKSANSEVSLAADTNTAVPSRLLLYPPIPDDLIERIWAYLTIQTLQRIRDRSENPNPALLRGMTATSLRYSYLNPQTRMVLAEQLSGVGASKGPVALSVWEQEVPSAVRAELSRATSALPDVYPITDAEGEGKFLVHVSVCFDINGATGDVISLVRDRTTGVYINGRLLSQLVKQAGIRKQQTFIGEIGAVLSSRNQGDTLRMRFTPSRVVISTLNHTLTWDVKHTLRLDDVVLRIDGRLATVTLHSKATEFTVIRYEATREKPDFVGFYMNKGTGLSDDAMGLIGPFQAGDANRFSLDSGSPAAANQPCQQQQPVATRGGPVFNEVSKKKRNCYVATHVQADSDLIKGYYADYIMSDIWGTN